MAGARCGEALVIAMLVTGCSAADHASSRGGSEAGSSPARDAGPTPGTRSDMVTSAVDASAPILTVVPVSPSVDDCLPGIYAGVLDCKVKLFDLFELPNGATMSLTLVEHNTQSAEFSTLEIAPGGELRSGGDAVLGTLSADLSGTLDCRTRKVSGTLSNGKYDQPLASQTFSGNFSADYDPGPPAALIQGTMLMRSNELPVDTNCTWMAQRTGP
jgi:hypothetical protein